MQDLTLAYVFAVHARTGIGGLDTPSIPSHVPEAEACNTADTVSTDNCEPGDVSNGKQAEMSCRTWLNGFHCVAYLPQSTESWLKRFEATRDSGFQYMVFIDSDMLFLQPLDRFLPRWPASEWEYAFTVYDKHHEAAGPLSDPKASRHGPPKTQVQAWSL